MAFKAKFLGRDAVMKKLARLVPDAEKDIAKAQLEAAQDLAAAIRPRAPKFGSYSESIKGERLADNPGKKVRGIGDTKDKNATGIFADYKWRWFEFGTRERTVKTTGKSAGRITAHPHIFPTYRAKQKSIRRKIAGAMNKAVKRAKG